MAAISIVSLSGLKSNQRLDAQYYHPTNVALDRTLRQTQVVELGEVAILTDGIHASIQFNEASDVLLISAMSPKQNYFELSKNRHIDLVQHARNPRTSLKIDDVIISTVGTIGNVAVVDKKVLPANSDRHVGIIRLKQALKPRYLSTFLLCKYGRYQTLRESTGNVQLNLFIDKLEIITVPKASQKFQELIESAVVRANELRSDAYENYRKAINDIEEKLGLSDLAINKSNISIRYLSNYAESNRLDAEYWLPKYDDYMQQIQKNKNLTLGELVSYKKGEEVGSEKYTDDGVPFVRVADFSPFGIESVVEKKIDRELYDQLKNNTPRKNEILLTKDGTIGMSYVLKEQQPCILSGAFLRLTTTMDIEEEYLSLVLNSSVGKMQMQRLTGGAIIAHLKPDDAMSLCIPIIDEPYQQSVSAIMKEVFRDIIEARNMFDTCIKAVELSVEKSEAEALSFLNALFSRND